MSTQSSCPGRAYAGNPKARCVPSQKDETICIFCKNKTKEEKSEENQD